MISWIAVAPMLALPGLIIFLLGLLPDVPFLNQAIGGGIVREFLVNHLLLSWLPYEDAVRVVAWYMHTDLAGELLLHALLALNINVLLLPLLYPLAAGYIGVNNWAAKTDLTLKRNAAKR